ncbi:MAG: DUF2062 domain-containing protein [Planctomycetaceae bacterium]|nr:DUF2062 domain-containing protein [Planctomycetaceae bacterium]
MNADAPASPRPTGWRYFRLIPGSRRRRTSGQEFNHQPGTLRALFRRMWHAAIHGSTPHETAAGAALGTFVGCTPAVGLQCVLIGLIVLLTRRWFRFSTPAAMLFVYWSNPLTILPLFWLSYRVGLLLVPGGLQQQQLVALIEADSFQLGFAAMHTVWQAGGRPLLLGSLILGLLGGLVTYPAVLWLMHRLPARAAVAAEATPAAAVQPAPQDRPVAADAETA